MDPTRRNQIPAGRGLGPRAAAQGRAPGLGRTGLREPRGTCARPRCRPEEHLPRLPQGRRPTGPAPAAERTPASLKPLPHKPLPTWAGALAPGFRRGQRRAECECSGPRSAAAASPASSSSSSSRLAGSRQISSPSRPARPSRSPPGWARPARESREEPAGAGLRRSLRQARGERGAAAGTARFLSGAGRAGGAAAALATPRGRVALAPAPVRERWRQRGDCSAFFLSAIEGFV